MYFLIRFPYTCFCIAFIVLFKHVVLWLFANGSLKGFLCSDTVKIHLTISFRHGLHGFHGKRIKKICVFCVICN